jgi:hypothetical protein
MNEINFSTLENKSSSELSNLLDDIEKQYKEALKQSHVVEQESEKIALDILKLQARKKELSIVLDKARYNEKQLVSTKRIINSMFWAAKNSGL